MSVATSLELIRLQGQLKSGLGMVQDTIRSALGTDSSSPAFEYVDYLLKSQGKLMRPILALLVDQCFSGSSSPHPEVVQFAAAIELIHMASLVHDDIIDDAQTRRNKATIYAHFGVGSAVALGVYLYAVSLRLLSQIGSIPIISQLSDAVQSMCEGELVQLSARRQLTDSYASYLKMIESKTADLFAVTCFGVATIHQQRPEMIDQARLMGTQLGMLFQLTDDYLDFFDESGTLKKEGGQDIRQSQVTLPIWQLMTHLSPEQKEELWELIRLADLTGVQHVMAPYETQVQGQCQGVCETHLNAYMNAAKSLSQAHSDTRLKIVGDLVFSRAFS